jgi:hypothetical protein
MKNIFVFLITIFAMTTMTQAQTSNQENGKLLRHVVLFKFKDGSSAADIKKVEDAFPCPAF